ncbi:LANO_0H00672g1_1 [Lachancea nothofagi CBS 11611]|uniref:LANO_0H00672g1_1 n=1 Tax=Lachancea nothofagi CBS 11611 TaxID=1266666 RepID=A0A1G4KKY0_9SACH|nr:LANO_0H00672g1_1 [Lachancea nothofagi CBS 11611]
MDSNLVTGDLVLCKVGSFAPWPAVVFPQQFLRKDVYRRRKAECVAVCFFNDETYYWDRPSKLRRLSKELIDEFLERAAASNAEDPTLVEAYEEARGFASLHEFLLQRMREENRMQDWDENADKGAKIEAGQDPFEGKKSGDKSRPAAVTKPKRERAAVAPSSSRSASSSSRSRSVPMSPSAASGRKHVRLDHAKRIEISMLLRRKLQTNLVQRETPPGIEEVKESHKLLGKISENMASNPDFFDLDALRQSKLHKLLKVIAGDDNLKEFHGQCGEILEAWKDVIAQLRKDKLKSQET